MQAVHEGKKVQKPPRKRKSRREQIPQYDGWWKNPLPPMMEYVGPLRCDYMTEFGISPSDIAIDEPRPTSLCDIRARSFVAINHSSFNVTIFAYVCDASYREMVISADGKRCALLREAELRCCTFWNILGVVKLPSQECYTYLERRIYPGRMSVDRWRSEVDEFFDDERRRAKLNPVAQSPKAKPPMQMPEIRSRGRLVQWPSVRALTGK